MPTLPAIVCYGEAHWHLLPGGKQAGGLPLRVAAYLQQAGVATQLVTKVGNDELGEELLGCIRAQGLDTRFVQRSETHLTGIVKAAPRAGMGASHKILEPVAWDYVQHSEELRAAVAQARMLVYSSLAARCTVSRETLYRLLQHAPFKALALSLRPPYSREVVKYLLRQADLVKLSSDDLATLAAWLGYPAASPETEAVPRLAERFGLQAVCLTRGGAGASLWVDGSWAHSTGAAAPLPDPGSYGEAFLAALLAGWATGAAPADCLQRACASMAGSWPGQLPPPLLN